MEMRTNILVWMVTCLLVSTSTHAGTLTSATWVGDFQGTPFTLVTSGASLTASGTATGNNIGAVSLTVAGPALTLMDAAGGQPIFISQTLGGSQTINSSRIANQGVPRAVNVFLGDDSEKIFLFPIAMSAGVGGNFSTTDVVPGLNIPVEVTATFFPWTTGSQVFAGLTSTTTTVGGAQNAGAALPDVTFVGSNSLVNGAGSITLVSPTVVRLCVGLVFGPFPCISGDSGNIQSSRLATATKLTLNFAAVPEPTAGGLLVTGAVISLLSARRRRSNAHSRSAHRRT